MICHPFKYSFVCALCTYTVHVFVCVVATCAHAYGGQRTTLGVVLQECLQSFLSQSLSLAWSLQSRLGWLASKPRGSTCLYLLNTGIFNVGSVGSNSHSHAYTASTLPTEASLQPSNT